MTGLGLRHLLIGCLAITIAQTGLAQTTKSFSVVSIHQNKTSATPGGPPFAVTGDGFRATNMPVIALFQMAYAPSDAGKIRFFPSSRILGVPDWTKNGEHYDIVAKVAAADLAAWHDPRQQPQLQRAMLQSMLADRFKAVAHRETKEISIYALTIAKGGPKFKQAESTDLNAIHTRRGGNLLPGGLGVLVPDGPTLHLYGAQLTILSQLLENTVGRPVENHTGLNGRYDFTLTMPHPSGPDDPQPSIFTAVQEQLGLKLDSAKGTQEVVVVDHVEHPTEN